MSEYNLEQSHEPQLLRQLRQKSLNLNMKIQKLTLQNKQKLQIKSNIESQLNKIKEQNQVQYKKHRSLIVLLNQLQQTLHTEYLEQKQQKQTDQTTSNLQNSILRFLLIKQTENVKQAEKLANFLKHILLDKNKGKAKQFIKKSNFIESQSEMIAKLKSQIYLLRNQNLQCKRKWYQLQQQSKNLQSHNKLLSIQNQRQKTQIKALYEEYLERINEAKTKIVSFNQTQKQSTINQHFVKQIAILQQKRVQIQEENQNLQFHFQNLKEELERIQIQHKQLLGFFGQPGQQGILAQKMKKRIQQLRDVLIECKRKNKNTRGVKLRKIVQNIKAKYETLIQSNDYVQLKTREQQNHGSFLQQKPIAQFFSKILQQKDKSLIVMRQQQSNLRQHIKQLSIQKQLLSNQITHLQQNLNLQNWQTKFTQDKNWTNITIQPYSIQKKSNNKQKQMQYMQIYGNEYTNSIKQRQNNRWGGNLTFDKRKI